MYKKCFGFWKEGSKMKNIKAYFALLTTVAVLGCFAISSPAYAEKDTGSNQPEQQIIQQTTQAPSTEKFSCITI